MSPQLNNIFAAVLVAGIIAMLAGFIAKTVYHPHKLEAEAYPIEVAEVPAAGGAAAAPATAEPIGDLLAAADPAAGEKLFKVCAACHTIDAGGANRIGPNLHGIVGTTHAHAAGFAYSEAMKAKAGTPWTVEELNAFIWNPKKTLPGTKMAYAGMKKPEDRAALIKFLQSN
jgi:cytochrome c